MARSEGVLVVVRIDLQSLRGGEEAGGRYNGDIGVEIGGGVGRGIERGLGWRGGITDSERVERSGMECGGRVIHQEIQRAGNMARG